MSDIVPFLMLLLIFFFFGAAVGGWEVKSIIEIRLVKSIVVLHFLFLFFTSYDVFTGVGNFDRCCGPTRL